MLPFQVSRSHRIHFEGEQATPGGILETDVRLAKELKKVLVEFGEKHGVAPLTMVTLLGSMILDLGLSLEAAVQDDLHSDGSNGSALFLKH